MGARLKIFSGVIGGAMAMAVPLIINLEGTRLQAYQDVASVWTICNGETQGVKPGDTKTPAECRSMTEHRVAEFMAPVYRMTRPDIKPHQLAAFTSFAYNIGLGGFAGSEARRLFNAGDFKGGCQAMMNWRCITVPSGQGDQAGHCHTASRNKRQNQGLVNRREKEIRLCLGGGL